MKNYNYRNKLSVFFLLPLLFMECKDFLEIDPPETEIIDKAVFANEATTKAVVAGLYSSLMESEYLFTSGINSITTVTGLSGDELLSYGSSMVHNNLYNNTLTGNETMSLWNDLYKTIYLANGILEGLEQNDNIEENLKSQWRGEALFIRAFCHFYLTNLFGKVPIVTSTDYRVNNQLSRSSSELVYQAVLSDLTEAESIMTEDFSHANGERIRPNKWVASALLARVYLYTEDWGNAELYASKLIDNSSFTLEDDLNSVFLTNSNEAIWHLQPVIPGYNTFDASTFVLTGEPTLVALNELQREAFEINDLRQLKWIESSTANGNTYYFSNKYKVKNDFTVTEYLMVLRLAEQYLIRSEARAKLNKLTEATDDINQLRERAGLPELSVGSQIQLLGAIAAERRSELFCEWGHRWFDMKRSNTIDEILGIEKLNWQPKDQLYPIPPGELTNNPALAPQNPGY